MRRADRCGDQAISQQLQMLTLSVNARVAPSVFSSATESR